MDLLSMASHKRQCSCWCCRSLGRSHSSGSCYNRLVTWTPDWVLTRYPETDTFQVGLASSRVQMTLKVDKTKLLDQRYPFQYPGLPGHKSQHQTSSWRNRRLRLLCQFVVGYGLFGAKRCSQRVRLCISNG